MMFSIFYPQIKTDNAENPLFPKKMKWILMHEFVTKFHNFTMKRFLRFLLFRDKKVKLSGSPKTFLCIKTSEKNDN